MSSRSRRTAIGVFRQGGGRGRTSASVSLMPTVLCSLSHIVPCGSRPCSTGHAWPSGAGERRVVPGCPSCPRAGPGCARQPPMAGGCEAGPQRAQVWHCTGRGKASILSRLRSEPASPRWCQRLGDPGGEVLSRKSAFENTLEGDDQETKLSRSFYGGKSASYMCVRPQKQQAHRDRYHLVISSPSLLVTISLHNLLIGNAFAHHCVFHML